MAKRRTRATIRRRTTATTGGTSKRTRTRTRARTVVPTRTRRTNAKHTRAGTTRTAESRARSRAAKKGWITRRAEAKKRSDAAKRGAITRARNTAARARDRARKSGKRGASLFPGGSQRPLRAEYIGAADYRASRRSSSVSLQISAVGPASASAKDAERAIQEKIDTGRSPKGWTIKMIDWQQPNAWSKLRAPLKAATLAIEKL